MIMWSPFAIFTSFPMRMPAVKVANYCHLPTGLPLISGGWLKELPDKGQASTGLKSFNRRFFCSWGWLKVLPAKLQADPEPKPFSGELSESDPRDKRDSSGQAAAICNLPC